MKAFLGIDPGQDGAWAVVAGSEAYGEPLPVIGKEVDGVELIRRIEEFCELQDYDVALTMIEDVRAFGHETPKSMFNFGYNTGLITGVCILRRWPFDRVSPKKWKQSVIPHVRGLKREDQKAAACAWVAKRYPNVELYPGRKRKPHDGVAEAVCIALHGRVA